MKNVLHIGLCTFAYHQISLSSIDYHVFLRSKYPEEKILAILADFGKENPKIVFEKIVSEVLRGVQGELEIDRRKNQLRILSQLRTLVFEKLMIMEHVSSFFKMEKDVCYIVGEREGEKKGEKKGELNKSFEVVQKLLIETDFTIFKIASLVGVSEAYVRKVKRGMI